MEKQEFNELAAVKSIPCISIYLATHRAGVEVNERHDSIHFKNILNTVEEELTANGIAKQQTDKLLAPAYTLLKEEEFWLNRQEGLAVLIADDSFKTIDIPFKVNTEVFVNSSYHLSPLLPFFCNREHYYLLMLSKNASSLFVGSAFGLERLTIEGLPQGLNDVIHFEEKSERKLFRGGGNAPGAEANFHGHGSGLADEKEYIAQYLKEVDQTLHTELLANERSPLILSGVEYMVGIYRQVSHYEHIATDALVGNFEHLSLDQLFTKTWEIAEPLLQEQKRKALKNYYDQSATPLTSDEAEKVIKASVYQQVSTLFVQENEHIWGTFNETDNELKINEQKDTNDECLINKAIINTLLNGGDVYVLEKDRMPNRALVAASLRFE
jgi:hypothetical protein